MPEFFFIIFLLTKNIFYFIGLFVVLAVVLTFLVIGWRENPYRLLCRSWWRRWFCWYVYSRQIRHYYERLKYGCSWDDAWNFDQYFLDVVPIGLSHVRESPLSPDSISEKDWNNMIVSLIAYKHALGCYEVDCPISHTKLREDFERAMGLLTKHFDKLWI